MRNIKISEGEHYHVFNRGVNKQVIFHDFGDYTRFLFLVLHFQFSKNIVQLRRAVTMFARTFGNLSQTVQHSVLDSRGEDSGELEGRGTRGVEVVAFSLMPNHFHLILKQTAENGISSYMQRVLNAYGKYYNTKYGKSGHVFQGPYKAVHIPDDLYLMHLSAYIHRNSREISEWFGKEDRYPWSSYQDYIKKNRWGDLLLPGIIMDRYANSLEYETFVKTSPAKLTDEEQARFT